MDEQREVATVVKPGAPAFNLTPKSLSEAMQLAKLMAGSDLVPKDFRGKPENVLVAVQMGAEVGLAPMQAIQNIAVINGRPSVWGDATLAIVQAARDPSGRKLLMEWIKETDDGETATCAVKRLGYPEPTIRTFSMTDAKTAGLLGKEGPWRSYPRRMRQMRARAFALRDGFADVLRGLAIREEVEDYGFLQARNITPEAENLMPQSKGGDAAPAKVEPGEPIREAENGKEEVASAAEEREPGSDDKVRFEIKGKAYETDGCTKEQLLETFRLQPLVDAKCGKNRAAKILIDEFHLNTRLELTEETADRYIHRLQFEAGEVEEA